jgi:hypothetical protein
LIRTLPAALLLLTFPALAFAGPADDVCSGSGPDHDAACAVKKAEADLAALRAQNSADMGDALAAMAEALSLRPSAERPAKDGDFQAYFAGLKDVKDGFLVTHDSGPLKKARDKWQWVYIRLRETLRKDRDRLQDIPVRVGKRAEAAAAIRASVEQAAGSVSNEELKRQVEKLVRRLRTMEKRLADGVRPGFDQSASALRDLYFWFEGDHSGLDAKMSTGVYDGDWDDPDARRSQVDRAEKNEEKDLRERRDDDLDKVQRGRDSVKSEWEAAD